MRIPSASSRSRTAKVSPAVEQSSTTTSSTGSCSSIEATASASRGPSSKHGTMTLTRATASAAEGIAAGRRETCQEGARTLRIAVLGERLGKGGDDQADEEGVAQTEQLGATLLTER